MMSRSPAATLVWKSHLAFVKVIWPQYTGATSLIRTAIKFAAFTDQLELQQKQRQSKGQSDLAFSVYNQGF